MKVLVIDDSQSQLLVTKAYIEDLGHRALCISDPEQAQTCFLDARPDLVLLDVVMPRMDGYEVARQLRAASGSSWIPIIFLSAQVTAEDVARGIDAGGDDYLTKPLAPVVLRAKMLAMQRIADMRRRLDEANRELRVLAEVDGLTGIPNRRVFDCGLRREWRRACRNRNPFSLILMDIDHFKHYNDHYGHQAGDECLRKVAKAISRCVKRPTDTIARYGGEEFAALLPDTSSEGAEQVAQRMRLAVAELQIPHAKSETASHITISLGMAAQNPAPGLEFDALLHDADKALYAAKAQGRNRVATGLMLNDSLAMPAPVSALAG